MLGFDEQMDTLGPGAFGKDRGDIGQEAVDDHGCFLQDELPGFYLGDIEDVVDDSQQVPGRCVYRVESFYLLGGDAFASKQVRHADDAVHRRADFMAHVGEEGALGNIGGFGTLLRGGQFDGALIHQGFQMVSMRF